ncbi:hypothetical protein ADU37_CDS16420 [Thermococcus sp. 2319x1]|uniref:DUF86 domain-containing protein n=1 Tax=Thermococcus sp. 2319x1 TaxID=1674923 RepID=UPI00073A9DCD|nr:HepT-like ribonuclease domain-containing protein [Thermococcus sp. 2319x1]ALV63341.1 hypothetical protein ADU37_CDS16420 [Thermococcus sp. 2319x1]
MKKEEIGYKAELIEKSIRLIRASLPKTQERFSKMGITKDGIYKQLEFAIQNLLDALSEISSGLKLGAVSYRGTIENLHEERIIDDELKEKLDSVQEHGRVPPVPRRGLEILNFLSGG